VVYSSDLEDFEAGDIQHTDEVLSLVLGVQCLVDTGHQPGEHLAVDGLGQGSHGVNYLLIHKQSHRSCMFRKTLLFRRFIYFARNYA